MSKFEQSFQPGEFGKQILLPGQLPTYSPEDPTQTIEATVVSADTLGLGPNEIELTEDGIFIVNSLAYQRGKGPIHGNEVRNPAPEQVFRPQMTDASQKATFARTMKQLMRDFDDATGGQTVIQRTGNQRDITFWLPNLVLDDRRPDAMKIAA